MYFHHGILNLYSTCINAVRPKGYINLKDFLLMILNTYIRISQKFYWAGIFLQQNIIIILMIICLKLDFYFTIFCGFSSIVSKMKLHIDRICPAAALAAFLPCASSIVCVLHVGS